MVNGGGVEQAASLGIDGGNRELNVAAVTHHEHTGSLW